MGEEGKLLHAWVHVLVSHCLLFCLFKAVERTLARFESIQYRSEEGDLPEYFIIRTLK